MNWTALASGMADKVFLYYAPKILAGMGAVPFAAGAGFSKMSDAALVKNVSLHRFGEDFAVEGYLRDPYAAMDDVVRGADFLIQRGESLMFTGLVQETGAIADLRRLKARNGDVVTRITVLPNPFPKS